MYELYDDYPIDEQEDEDYPVISATDMTGAIPRAIPGEDELEAYEDIYPFYED